MDPKTFSRSVRAHKTGIKAKKFSEKTRQEEEKPKREVIAAKYTIGGANDPNNGKRSDSLPGTVFMAWKSIMPMVRKHNVTLQSIPAMHREDALEKAPTMIRVGLGPAFRIRKTSDRLLRYGVAEIDAEVLRSFFNFLPIGFWFHTGGEGERRELHAIGLRFLESRKVLFQKKVECEALISHPAEVVADMGLKSVQPTLSMRLERIGGLKPQYTGPRPTKEDKEKQQKRDVIEQDRNIGKHRRMRDARQRRLALNGANGEATGKDDVEEETPFWNYLVTKSVQIDDEADYTKWKENVEDERLKRLKHVFDQEDVSETTNRMLYCRDVYGSEGGIPPEFWREMVHELMTRNCTLHDGLRRCSFCKVGHDVTENYSGVYDSWKGHYTFLEDAGHYRRGAIRFCEHHGSARRFCYLEGLDTPNTVESSGDWSPEMLMHICPSVMLSKYIYFITLVIGAIANADDGVREVDTNLGHVNYSYHPEYDEYLVIYRYAREYLQALESHYEFMSNLVSVDFRIRAPTMRLEPGMMEGVTALSDRLAMVEVVLRTTLQEIGFVRSALNGTHGEATNEDDVDWEKRREEIMRLGENLNRAFTAPLDPEPEPLDPVIDTDT